MVRDLRYKSDGEHSLSPTQLTEIVVTAPRAAIDGLAPSLLAIGLVGDANILGAVGAVRVVVTIKADGENKVGVDVPPATVT